MTEILSLLAFSLFLISTSTLFAQGYLFDVSLPITSNSSQSVVRALEISLQEIEKRAKTDNSSGENELVDKPTLILQFRIPKHQDEFGRGSSFGACYELADFLLGEKFQSVRTIAYFPQSVKGHALLVALACNERIADSEAEIGEATVDEKDISPTQRKGYHEIAERRGGISVAVVDKILDPQAVLMQVETEQGIRLISPNDVEELRKSETFAEEPSVVIPAGQPGLFSADSARKIGLVNRIAEDQVAVARSLGYRPDDLKYAAVARQSGSAIRINLNGPINVDNTTSVLRRLQSAIDPPTDVASSGKTPKIDFICLCIDSPGGNIEASLNLASYIVQNIDSSQIRTVAYIPYQARSDAALIALACDEIVLGPKAVLGGDGASVFSEQQIRDAKQTIREFLGRESLRSWSLPLAFVDPELEVFKATRQGRPTLTDYFSEEELEQQPDARLWNRGETIKPKGELLKIVDGEGPQYLVDRSAKDFAEFKLLYRLDDEPLLIEPGWADKLVRFLSSPGMSATILLVVFFALMIELQTPGIGIGAFIAVMGIVMFFWLHFLGGTAGWLEVSLFLSGICFILLEIFVLPGIGVFGIGGALAIVASLVLASQTFIVPQNSYQYGQLYNSLLILAVSGIGVFLLAGAMTKTIHRITRPNDTELIRETERLANYDSFLGRTGTAITPLVPSGRVSFAGEPVDVVSDGSLIEKGATVEVVEVVGYKVVVRQTV